MLGGTYEARVYPRGTGGLGRDTKSDPVKVDRIGPRQSSTAEGRILVSNLLNPASSTDSVHDEKYVAHAFTTGSKSSGYPLETVRVLVRINRYQTARQWPSILIAMGSPAAGCTA